MTSFHSKREAKKKKFIIFFELLLRPFLKFWRGFFRLWDFEEKQTLDIWILKALSALTLSWTRRHLVSSLLQNCSKQIKSLNSQIDYCTHTRKSSIFQPWKNAEIMTSFHWKKKKTQQSFFELLFWPFPRFWTRFFRLWDFKEKRTLTVSNSQRSQCFDIALTQKPVVPHLQGQPRVVNRGS